ncbi:hypothetical protein EDD15DRAFT_2372268 [Pisolithus albus]|nr:hypothetical protein EDD15DRAFT_2372268 [Pisolithus albus]
MPTLHQYGRSLLFALALIVPSAWADYYIDDTNATLTYSSGPKAAWGPFAAGASTLSLLLPNGTYQAIDPFVCYNHTYRCEFIVFAGGTCLTRDKTLHATRQIPAFSKCPLLTMLNSYQGSGITVFVYQAGPVGINASISIDGGYNETNVLSAPPAPNYEIANVSMFSVQELETGSHTLWMTVNDLFGSYSGMMFDYAYVNETLVSAAEASAATATTSSTSSLSSGLSTPATAPASATSSSTLGGVNIGAIVGGVLGGVALIMVGVIAALCLRRRRRSGTVNLISEGDVQPYDPYIPYDPPVSQVQAAYNVGTGPNSSTQYATTTSSLSTPLTPNRRQPAAETGTDSTPFLLTSSSAPLSQDASSSSSGRDRKTHLVSPNPPLRQSLPDNGRVVENSTQELPPSLTDEQADFITGLYNNNIPAPVVARVVQRMLVDRQAGVREWESELGLTRSHSIATTAPPSYDAVNRT